LLSEMVDRVELPGTQGRFVALKDHAPLISSLEKGEIRWAVGEKEERIAIVSGFVEVNGNHVSACVELQ